MAGLSMGGMQASPRTVRTNRACPGVSTFILRNRTKLSIVLLPTSASPPQTFLIIKPRETTRPAFRLSSSRITYSVRVSSISWPSLNTSLELVFKISLPTYFQIYRLSHRPQREHAPTALHN